MRLYFAGADSGESMRALLDKHDVKYRLESFYALGKRAPRNPSTLLLDSGGFVARTRNIIIDVESYGRYIKAHGIQLAFNLDTNDFDETMRNQEYLEKNTDAKILPIYHLSDFIDNRNLLQEFIDKDYDYLGIGGVAGENSPRQMQKAFYDYVFHIVRDKVRTHGLGITARPILSNYPWYSVDSTTWLNPAKYGQTIANVDKRVKIVRKKSNHYLINLDREIGYWLKVEKQLTELWQKRGVDFS